MDTLITTQNTLLTTKQHPSNPITKTPKTRYQTHSNILTMIQKTLATTKNTIATP